jgi:cytoskeleton protein RodZ
MRVGEQAGKKHAGGTFGEILKRKRLARGFTLSEISAATKISVRHLKSLESNEFSALPGGVFSKGFLRAYAIHIGLDPEEMVNHYLFEIAGRSEAPPLDEQISPEEIHRSRQRRALLVAVAALVLVVAAALWFFMGS